MTPNEFRLKVLCHAATSYSMQYPTDATARHVERAAKLAEECVQEATRWGMFGAVAMPPSAVTQSETAQPIMPPPLQGFAQPEAQQAAPAATAAAAAIAPGAFAPQQAVPQVPMQPLPQSAAPQMQIHPSTPPIPQMPVQAAMQNVSQAPQIPMQQGVGGGGFPVTVPQQVAPSAPINLPLMATPPQGSVHQPFGPHGPSIPLPPPPAQPQHAQQQAAQGQPSQQPGTPVQGAPGLFVPPQTMGGTNTVVQAPLPENFSALGGIGVQEKVEQRPMAQGPIVTPGNQSVVSGGSMPTVVGEKVTH